MRFGAVRGRIAAIWAALTLVLLSPIALAAMSPYLAWRDPIYIAAGFAGIFAMSLLALQPMLASGYLPGVGTYRQRQSHRWIGGTLLLAIVLHVGGLWITSPPDVIDALLFRSPTPFSIWGVIAMWALFTSAVITAMRSTIGLFHWRRFHKALAIVIVLGSVVHAVLIEGTMEVISKFVICALAVLALAATSLTIPSRLRLSKHR